MTDLSGIGSSRRPIVVIGAGGKTGRECVRVLLRKGLAVRAAARGELRQEDLGTDDLPADDVDLLLGLLHYPMLPDRFCEPMKILSRRQAWT